MAFTNIENENSTLPTREHYVLSTLSIEQENKTYEKITQMIQIVEHSCHRVNLKISTEVNHGVS